MRKRHHPQDLSGRSSQPTGDLTGSAAGCGTAAGIVAVAYGVDADMEQAGKSDRRKLLCGFCDIRHPRHNYKRIARPAAQILINVLRPSLKILFDIRG